MFDYYKNKIVYSPHLLFIFTHILYISKCVFFSSCTITCQLHVRAWVYYLKNPTNQRILMNEFKQETVEKMLLASYMPR